MTDRLARALVTGFTGFGLLVLAYASPPSGRAQGADGEALPERGRCPNDPEVEYVCSRRGTLVKKWVCTTTAGGRGIANARLDAILEACGDFDG